MNDKSVLDIKIEGVIVNREKNPPNPMKRKITISKIYARFKTWNDLRFDGRSSSSKIGKIPLCDAKAYKNILKEDKKEKMKWEI